MSNINEIYFYDLFDQNEIQELQNLFSDAHGVSSVITDLEGNLLTTPSNFTSLCKMVIANSPENKSNCFAMEQWADGIKKNVDQTKTQGTKASASQIIAGKQIMGSSHP